MSLKSKWGQILRAKQNRAELTLKNVYDIRVAVTTGEKATKRALEGMKSCITSHTGKMSITSSLTPEGENICLATQTQAVIIGIPNSQKTPK